ncbi:hypothetical protein [Pseudomonas sp. UBA6323]|uniref:hypothetical protein n=1 Tax=Pseudomonas sp. UBA6323 TaxID=1947329 RepID=UPI0025E6F9CC|nr:hypothetical protein [Pseudomonas sp. UBA6323]
MRVNQPLTPEQHVQEDEQHRKRTENSKAFLEEVASLIEAGEPLSPMQKEWAAGAIRAFAASLPLERKRNVGAPLRVPDEAILLRQVYISGGMPIGEAEEKLASLYEVDLETLQSRIKRLAKTTDPTEWGFRKWGAN